MRRLIVLAGLATLAFLLIGNGTMLSHTNYSQDQLDAWQAIAETYYTSGVNETEMVDNPLAEGRPNMWGFRDANAIQSGMIAPDFTLLDMDGQPVKLSDFIGEKFIILITGSWF